MTRRPLARDEARERADLLHVSSYAVTLDLTEPGELFRSTSRIRFGCRRPGASTFADITAVAVKKAVLNGRRLDLAEALDGSRLRLDLLDHTNELTVVAECRYSRSGEGLHRFTDPADGLTYTYSQTFLYDAQRVFACFDQPDLKAAYDVTLVLPAGWLGVANCEVVSRPDGGAGGAWRFATTPPLPTYVVFAGAGPYHVVRSQHRGVALGLYCRRSLAPYLDADEFFDVTARGFDFYEDLFGVAYPFGKYDQLAVPEFNAGAMENAGAVTFREERAIFRSRGTEKEWLDRASTIVHELAHMWFGDLVTMRWWDDLWLNESFATWMAAHTLASVTRYDNAWTAFCNVEKAWGYRQDLLPSTHPVSADVSDTDTALLNFDGISYAKGASVLKQLVAWVGLPAFVAGLRTYFDRHAWGSTSLADLLLALEEASGRELGAWADEWLREPGVNTLRPSFSVGADGCITSFAVEQSGTPSRRHRMAVGLYALRDSALARVDRVEVDVAGAATPVPALLGRLRPDLVLVNDDDLTYARTRFDDVSLATVRAHLGAMPDPLARALCWFTLWDMTRDAELRARDYVDLVCRHLGAESDVTVVETLLANVTLAIHQYADPAAVADLLAAAASTARACLAAAEPGGERQLACARGLATFGARTHTAELRGWLDGAGVPAGLAVDAELRWYVLGRLAAAGLAGPAEVDAELARDRTAAGEKHATTARAALPDPACKEAIWAAAVESDALSNHLVLAAGVGFWQPGQESLLAPYVGRYLAALPRLWRDRPPEIAQLVARQFFPWTLVTPSVAAEVDSLLAAASPASPLRRIVVERRDDLARALRARAADTAPAASSVL